MATDVDGLIEELAQARGRFITAVKGLSPEQAAFRPSDEEWSVCQMVEHLVLAEQSGVSKIWAAAEDARQGRAWVGENPNRGLSIEEIVARTWPPKLAAPPVADPHFGGPLSYWIAMLEACQPVVAQLGDALRELDAGSVIFPHFVCGPLDAHQRLAFLRFHSDRHLEQLRRLLAHPSFPAA